MSSDQKLFDGPFPDILDLLLQPDYTGEGLDSVYAQTIEHLRAVETLVRSKVRVLTKRLNRYRNYSAIRQQAAEARCELDARHAKLQEKLETALAQQREIHQKIREQRSKRQSAIDKLCQDPQAADLDRLQELCVEHNQLQTQLDDLAPQITTLTESTEQMSEALATYKETTDQFYMSDSQICTGVSQIFNLAKSKLAFSDLSSRFLHLQLEIEELCKRGQLDDLYALRDKLQVVKQEDESEIEPEYDSSE